MTRPGLRSSRPPQSTQTSSRQSPFVTIEDILAWRERDRKAEAKIKREVDTESVQSGPVPHDLQSNTTNRNVTRWNRVVTRSLLDGLWHETSRGIVLDGMHPDEVREVLHGILPRLRRRYPNLRLTASSLTSKYYHLWTQYRDILNILNRPEVTYDDATGIVTAPLKTWDWFIEKFPQMAGVSRRGLPFVESYMSEVWPATTATSEGTSRDLFGIQAYESSEDENGSTVSTKESAAVMPTPSAPRGRTRLNRVATGRVKKESHSPPANSANSIQSCDDSDLAEKLSIFRYRKDAACVKEAIMVCRRVFRDELGPEGLLDAEEFFFCNVHRCPVFVALRTEGQRSYLKQYGMLETPAMT